ncbi:BZ3500_MvSof-1268-A1-R1_Chr4-3g07277 [Microbotryum saponariae]|uniref:BZ3500_MvSof-1268-A1-R1_Chr4-3g07277 protein n=1 Tax=Microbotryum saponariae TaxID=289078 RepID=A0A2X0KUH5_9BASI|nr:BZ3500_MvSof-1268-A1-R1_Chr4-3g07277 [Microbotryum saponariae]SDA06940.1 BZ3501_MvSof-1269-A2-R1_Chr4-2g06986 [Microbotryum saponariae]
MSRQVWSTLRATVGTAFAVQAVCASVAIPLQTEKYYDLAGSATFIGCTLVSLYWRPLRAGLPLPSPLTFHPRQIVMSAFCCIWAGRLGSFLFQRIQRSGSDSRFDEIKKQPTKFAGAWVLQGVWVSLTAFPVFCVNAVPAHLQPRLGIRDAIACALWLSAFGYEVTADRQKSAWRAAKEAKEHDEKFITSGLWSQSRHPNYVGEVLLWAAQFVGSTSALLSPAVAGPIIPHWLGYLAVASPMLEYALIRYISGVPMLEESGDKKYGDDPRWKEYKRTTPVFFPRPW